MTNTVPDAVQDVVAPSAIERALSIYQQMQECDQATLTQARKIVTDQIYALINAGESDEQKLVVGALAHVKAIDRARTNNPQRHRAQRGDQTAA